MKKLGLVIGTSVTALVVAVSCAASPQSPTAPASSAPTGASPAPADSRTTFTDGVYEVGPDIEAGKYKTAGPTNTGIPCYWARLKDTSGTFDSIIASGAPQGQAAVTISDTDAAVEAIGGCVWEKVG